MTTTTVRVPEGMRFFEVKSDDPRTLIIPDYVVGKGNKYADEGQKYYERTFWVHRNIGVNGNSYVCAARTFKEKCPICEDFQKLKASGADEEVLTPLKPKERQLFVVKERDSEDGWLLWDVSYFLFGQQLDAEIRNSEEDDDYDLFGDWENGLYLRVAFQEKRIGSGSPFYIASSINFKQRPALSKDEIESIPCLDELLVKTPYKELKSIYEQQDLETEEEGEEEAPASATNGKASRSRKKEPEPAPAPAAKSESTDEDIWDEDW